MPDMELKPPKPDTLPQSVIPIEVGESGGKPQAEISTEKEKDETSDNNKEPTAELLKPIVITTAPEIDPAATAGKWPTEPPTASTSSERDAENET